MLAAYKGSAAGPDIDAEALLKAGALQNAIFNSANFSCIATDTSGVIQIFNVGAERMLGYASADVLNSITPADISDPEELIARARALSVELGTSIKSGFEALVFKASRGIEDIYELTYIRKDGSRFPAVVSVTALRDAQDAILGYLLIGTDNTARKRLENERTQLEQQLRDRESNDHRLRLAAIVDCSNDAIIGKTLDGIITSWNEGARRIFGYAEWQMLGQPVSRLVPVDREAEEPEILAKLLRGERVEHFDTVRVHENGQEVHASVTISPVRNSAGELSGASMIVRDISERHRAEEALARAREAADTASRELEAFSYTVAHDLRAPLRGMNGFAHVLLNTYRDKLDADGQDWLEEIVLNAGKMGALIDALLSLGRLTKSEPRRESVDLSSLVRETARQLAAAEPERTVQVIIEDHLTADLDPVLARALVENLLGNAWKFTGKVPLARVEFGASSSNGTRAFFVRDNGAGFDMNYVDKLFGHFQRLHAAEDFPGTGIGLATVQRIARRHGGHAWAEGIVNGGATFYFSIPDRTSGALR
jgi:PAS domain S-box-containing protein